MGIISKGYFYTVKCFNNFFMAAPQCGLLRVILDSLWISFRSRPPKVT